MGEWKGYNDRMVVGGREWKREKENEGKRDRKRLKERAEGE